MKLRRTKSSLQTSQSRTPKSRRSEVVHSYYTPAKQGVDQIDNTKRRSASKPNILRSTLVKRVAIVMFVLFVGLTVSVLSDEPIISLTGSQAVTSTERYSQRVQSLLGSSVLNTNKITLRQESIERALMEEYPEIVSADVTTMVLGKKPLVQIELLDIPLQVSSNGISYAVTSNGRIAGKTSEFALLKNTVVINDQSGVVYEKGNAVFRSDDVRFIETLTEVIKSKGRGVEYIRLTAIPREIYVKTTDKPYEIRMFLEEDVAQQIGSWFSVEKVVGEAGGEAPTQYIDVRAGEKVYWL